MEQSRELPDGVFVHPRVLCESGSVGVGTLGVRARLAGRGGRHGLQYLRPRVSRGRAIVGERVTEKNQVIVFVVILTNGMKPCAVIKRNGESQLPTLVRRGATGIRLWVAIRVNPDSQVKELRHADGRGPHRFGINVEHGSGLHPHPFSPTVR